PGDRGRLGESLDGPLVRLDDAEAEPKRAAELVVERRLEARVLLPDEVAGLDAARGLRLRLVLARLAEVAQRLRGEAGRIRTHAGRLQLDTLDDDEPRPERGDLVRRDGADRHERVGLH